MGMILESTPAMGEYSVEVRRESFYLRGEDNYERDGRHAITVYEVADRRTGTVEILIEDISKIRASLDEVEKYLSEKPRNK